MMEAGVLADVLVVDKEKTYREDPPKYTIKVYYKDTLYDIDTKSDVYEKLNVGAKVSAVVYKDKAFLKDK